MKNRVNLFIMTLACIIGFKTSMFAQTASNKSKEGQQKLVSEMVKETAPPFSLQDLDGKQVALDHYKVKVLVLDFWSTWCVPCKKSFPAMQLAQQKYAKDSTVKFLFIHTWETSNTVEEEVKKYLATSGFDFHVLMDLKKTSGHNAMVEAYQVSAIPAKFIIDKKGKIAFKLTGFDGTDTAALEEISTRIEMAKSC